MVKSTFTIKKLNTTALSLLFFAAFSPHAAFGMDENKSDLPKEHQLKSKNQVNLVIQSEETQKDPIKEHITSLAPEKQKELQDYFQLYTNLYRFDTNKKKTIKFIKKLNTFVTDISKEYKKSHTERSALVGLMAMKIGTVVMNLRSQQEVSFMVSVHLPPCYYAARGRSIWRFV